MNANSMHTMIHRKGWPEQRRELQKQIDAQVDNRCLEIVRAHKADVIDRELNIAKKIETKLLDIADKQSDPEALFFTARALQSSHTVTSRLVGVGNSAQPGTSVQVLVATGVTPRQVSASVKTIEAEIVEDGDPF